MKNSIRYYFPVIQIPTKGLKNMIAQKQVRFTVFADGNIYTAKTMLDQEELLEVNLPEYFGFKVVDNAPIFNKGVGVSLGRVVEDLYLALRNQAE